MLRRMIPWLARAKNRFQDQQGLGLVEALVAVAILGTSVVAFVVALSAGSIAVGKQDEEVVAQGLAQTQLAHIKGYPYDPGATTYPTVSTPEGYTIAVGVAPVPNTDADIQKITVTVSRKTREITPTVPAKKKGAVIIPQKIETIITVADYKVNR